MSSASLQAQACFAMYGIKLEQSNPDKRALKEHALARLSEISDVSTIAVKVICVTGRSGGSADHDPVISHAPSYGKTNAHKSSGVALTTPAGTPLTLAGTRSLRTACTNMQLMTKDAARARSTQIIATLGPASCTEESLHAILASGCSCVRLNFSHGDHASAPRSRFHPSADLRSLASNRRLHS
jgi:Pyruvate kinase, barrel domain